MSVDTLTLRWSGILLGILFIAAMLSACGDSDGSTPQTTSASDHEFNASDHEFSASDHEFNASDHEFSASDHEFNASGHACRWQSGSERQYGFHVSRRLHSMVFR